MRHEMEERRAKQMLREEEGTGRKGNLRIDLESGVVVIPSNGHGAGADDRDCPAGSDDGDGVADDAGDGAVADTDGDEVAGDDTAKDAAYDNARSSDDDQRATDVDEVHGGQAGGDALAAVAAPRAGQPQPATRSAGAVPTGKAGRRTRGGSTSPTPVPAGKPRHGH